METVNTSKENFYLELSPYWDWKAFKLLISNDERFDQNDEFIIKHIISNLLRRDQKEQISKARIKQKSILDALKKKCPWSNISSESAITKRIKYLLDHDIIYKDRACSRGHNHRINNYTINLEYFFSCLSDDYPIKLSLKSDEKNSSNAVQDKENQSLFPISNSFNNTNYYKENTTTTLKVSSYKEHKPCQVPKSVVVFSEIKEQNPGKITTRNFSEKMFKNGEEIGLDEPVITSMAIKDYEKANYIICALRYRIRKQKSKINNINSFFVQAFNENMSFHDYDKYMKS
ncbi:MAG: hypothetical protein OEZ36_00035 [Spirochaetota bacterium]|nr:hypothetical protein [Spirochaetota bacterium]